MVKFFMFLMDCLRAVMDSGVIWIISLFFIMFDLVFSSEFGFNVLLNIIKFVFVIKIKICIFKIFLFII